MAFNVEDVRQLEKTKVHWGDKWIYVADFNISSDLESTSRVDVEVDDLRQLSESGAVTVILAHQGRYGNTEHLDFIAPYLEEELGRKVRYFRENDTEKAVRFVDTLKDGEVTVMGNTRFHKGEEKNDDVLSKKFANLVLRSDKQGYVAIGGFGKAHRKNASNVGILQHLPGYATRSQLREMQLLEPWAGRDENTYSVAVLGGVKKEKITIGLVGLVENYDAIIPGGIVLNTILKVKGYDIGDSVIDDKGETFEDKVEEVLEGKYGSRVHIPSQVVIARETETGYRDIDLIDLEAGKTAPKGYKIVSYKMPQSAIVALEHVVETKGRFILAGTPDLYKEGLGFATNEVIERLKRCSRGIVLGEDTSREIRYDGTVSTGGGSALYFLVNETTPVFEALKENKRRFKI